MATVQAFLNPARTGPRNPYCDIAGEVLPGDPVSGVVKQLRVQYRIDGKPGEASFQEDDTIMLPIPK